MATQSSLYGAFVPTTNVWDPQQIYGLDIDDNLKQVLVRLYQNLNVMANVVNVKDTGQYNNAFETVNNQQWFPNPSLNSLSSTTPAFRQVYRTVINWGSALPNAAGSASVNHNITINSGYTFTRIYGVANDPATPSYIPLPYASPTLINNIELSVNATQVTITVGKDRSNYTTTYVVLEYIKS